MLSLKNPVTDNE